jgi:O-antigen/teichoic acid export membrane protein
MSKIYLHLLNLYIYVCSLIFTKVFHKKETLESTLFFKNIFYVALGTFVATFFSFIFNISAGRLLGPNEYGKFTILESLAMFLYIPMLMGFSTSMVKYNSEKGSFYRQKAIISTSYILTFVSTVLFLTIYIYFSNSFIGLFSISSEIYYLSVIFAFCFVFYTLTKSTLRSLHEMKKLSILRPAYSITVLFIFLLFIFKKNLTYKAMAYSIYGGYIVSIVIIGFIIRKYIKLSFDVHWAKKLIRYGNFTIIGGVSYILYTNVDKLLINKYMLSEDVGIYNAYNFASLKLVAILLGIFQTVFFPTVSKYPNKKPLIRVLNKFIICVLLLGLPFTMLSEYIILNLYGDAYNINYILMFLFAITSLLFVCNDLYAWFLNSVGIAGVRVTSVSAVIILISDIIFNIYLIPLFGLQGAIAATGLSYIVGVCIMLVNINKLLDQELPVN